MGLDHSLVGAPSEPQLRSCSAAWPRSSADEFNGYARRSDLKDVAPARWTSPAPATAKETATRAENERRIVEMQHAVVQAVRTALGDGAYVGGLESRPDLRGRKTCPAGFRWTKDRVAVPCRRPAGRMQRCAEECSRSPDLLPAGDLHE